VQDRYGQGLLWFIASKRRVWLSIVIFLYALGAAEVRAGVEKGFWLASSGIALFW